MALVVRVLGVLGSLLLRLALVLLVLFAGHLLIARAWPELRQTAQALEQSPLVQQQLSELERTLAGESQSLQNIERQLRELSDAKVRALTLQLADLEQRLETLRGEHQGLLDELAKLQREQDEYCASFNPFKRWTCHELRERFGALSARLTPIMSGLERDIQTATHTADTLRKDLELLTDSTLSMEAKAARLGSDATLQQLSVSASRRRVEQLAADASALRAQLVHLKALESSSLGWLMREWRAVQWRLLGAAVLILALPWLQRLLNYFVLMPLITRLGAPLRLAPDASAGVLHFGTAERSLPIRLQPGTRARVRSPYARPVQGPARSQLLYQWRAPLISYASGLRLLICIDADANGAEVTLSAPHDPNSYLMRIDFEQHPGLVIHPKHLVGVIGEPVLATHWRLFSLHAWCTWQLRYITIGGTGSVVLEGYGDIVATEPRDKPTKIEQELMIGFDTRLAMSTARTEIFLPYLLGKAALVDDLFEGNGALFWQKSIKHPQGNIVSRSMDAFWSALGKVLGF